MKRARIQRIFPGVPRVSLLAQRVKKEFCIVVSDRGGVVDSLWFPPVSRQEIEAYWAGQPSADVGKMPEHLGGEWIDEQEYGGAYGQFSALARRLRILERYRAVACCDDDSYLATPDGRVVVHTGCSEEFRNYEMKQTEAYIARWKSGYFWKRHKRKPNRHGALQPDKRKEQRQGRMAAKPSGPC